MSQSKLTLSRTADLKPREICVLGFRFHFLSSLFGHYLAHYSVAESDCNKFAAYRKIIWFVNNMVNHSNLTGLRPMPRVLDLLVLQEFRQWPLALPQNVGNCFCGHSFVLNTSIQPRITIVSKKMPKIKTCIFSGVKFFCFSRFKNNCVLHLQLSCAM
jgi:hypothetical protein